MSTKPPTNAKRKTYETNDAAISPWSFGTKVRMAIWSLVWLFFFRPTPKFFRPWRILLLRCFGSKISGRAEVAASAVIKMPWNLEMEDRAAIGYDAEIYNLGKVTMKARSTVSQHCYICTGSHDLSIPTLPLVTSPIVIGEDVWIGACALVLQGVTIHTGAIVAANSNVTRDVEPWVVVAGNPARFVKKREINIEAWRRNGSDVAGAA